MKVTINFEEDNNDQHDDISSMLEVMLVRWNVDKVYYYNKGEDKKWSITISSEPIRGSEDYYTKNGIWG